MMKIGEVRVAEDADFAAFTALCDDLGTDWTKEFDKKGLALYIHKTNGMDRLVEKEKEKELANGNRTSPGDTQLAANGVTSGGDSSSSASANSSILSIFSGFSSSSAEEAGVRMAKLRITFTDVRPATLFDVLHDPEYRKVWDRNMQESVDIALINPCNDISYYSMNLFPPIAPRDFVLQRSWIKQPGREEYLIFNHSVDHKKYPPRKGVVRAISYLTGYLIRGHPDPKAKNPSGTQFTYLTHCDPRGNVPTWAVNRMTRIMAPKTVKRLRKLALKYPEWKRAHKPNLKPWVFPEQFETPRIDWSDVQVPEGTSILHALYYSSGRSTENGNSRGRLEGEEDLPDESQINEADIAKHAAAKVDEYDSDSD